MWRVTPRTLARLIVGLWIFGTGDGLIVLGTLGNSPWTVLAQGAAEQTGTGVGEATIVISFLVLLLWIPIRQRPGLGTILNAILVGVAIEVTTDLLPEAGPLWLRLAFVLGGIALVGVGSGLYLTCGAGPGPRDGLMTGLHARTGRSLRLIRTGIELSAVALGIALGGTAGVGTILFALLIGPAVQLSVGLAGGLPGPAASRSLPAPTTAPPARPPSAGDGTAPRPAAP